MTTASPEIRFLTRKVTQEIRKEKKTGLTGAFAALVGITSLASQVQAYGVGITINTPGGSLEIAGALAKVDKSKAVLPEKSIKEEPSIIAQQTNIIVPIEAQAYIITQQLKEKWGLRLELSALTPIGHFRLPLALQEPTN